MQRIAHAIALMVLLLILAWMAASVAHVSRIEPIEINDDYIETDDDGDPCPPHPLERTWLTAEHPAPYFDEPIRSADNP